ncbi:MAG: DUF695 domain-containing protein [Paramuribaculum sp.]|nr:DUF695 domain-containing protein [Paramuribaculum sp.]
MTKEALWWTAPAEADNGRTIMVTGRKDVDKFRQNPRFNIRVEIIWKYQGDSSGMPDQNNAEMMDRVTSLLEDTFSKDPVAVLTGIFTGDDERDWIFYTLSTHIFGKKLNEALASLPLLPLEISAENDPGWEQYEEMKQAEIQLD